MRPALIILALAAPLTAFAAGADMVRLPFQPQTMEERRALQHLRHAHELIRKAHEEIRQAHALRAWPDLDWASLEQGTARYVKTLEKFIFPAYRFAPYPEGNRGNASLAAVAEPEIYPNGEDVVGSPVGKPGGRRHADPIKRSD